MTDIEEEKQWKEWLNNRSNRVQTKILNHINNGMDRDESMFRVLKEEFILTYKNVWDNCSTDELCFQFLDYESEHKQDSNTYYPMVSEMCNYEKELWSDLNEIGKEQIFFYWSQVSGLKRAIWRGLEEAELILIEWSHHHIHTDNSMWVDIPQAELDSIMDLITG